jgi:hypothetical protein
VSRSLRQPPSQDWPALLLEAIQQRDAPRALAFALRCVHRQGMGALDAVFERADGAGGQDGDARSWLLPLLKQASPVVVPSPAPSAPSIPPPRPTPPAAPAAPAGGAAVAATAPLAEALPIAAEVSPSPIAEASPPQPEPSPPIAEPSPASPDPVATDLPWSSLPFADSPPASVPPTPERDTAPAGVTASAALDQAFAPLEIAFPPLPTFERTGADSAAVSTASPVPPAGSAPVSAPFASEPAPATLDARDGHDGAEPAPRVHLPSGHERLLGDFPTGHAAPVPTFQVEGSEESASRPSRKSRQTDPAADHKTPASRTLDVWRSWLPGPFRSRSRP